MKVSFKAVFEKKSTKMEVDFGVINENWQVSVSFDWAYYSILSFKPWLIVKNDMNYP